MSDLISREQAIAIVNRFQSPDDTMAKFEVVDLLKDIPSAEKKGRWMAYEVGDERWRKCSVCGTADEYINHLGLVAIRNYCPSCGARMVQ